MGFLLTLIEFGAAPKGIQYVSVLPICLDLNSRGCSTLKAIFSKTNQMRGLPPMWEGAREKEETEKSHQGRLKVR